MCEVEQNCGLYFLFFCFFQFSLNLILKFRYLCQLHFLIICHIHAYYTNRTVIFKDIDPKVNAGSLTGHIKLSDDINRFANSYLSFGNCDNVEANTVDVIDVISCFN